MPNYSNKFLHRYWKSPKGREIDFIVRKGAEIEEAIQVCLTLIVREEEVIPEGDRRGITIIPLWQWLLSKHLWVDPVDPLLFLTPP